MTLTYCDYIWNWTSIGKISVDILPVENCAVAPLDFLHATENANGAFWPDEEPVTNHLGTLLERICFLCDLLWHAVKWCDCGNGRNRYPDFDPCPWLIVLVLKLSTPVQLLRLVKSSFLRTTHVYTWAITAQEEPSSGNPYQFYRFCFLQWDPWRFSCHSRNNLSQAYQWQVGENGTNINQRFSPWLNTYKHLK